MPKERFLTRFQRDQVDRLFWDELKTHSANPQRLKPQSDSPYVARAKELRTPNATKDEFLNLGAEMKAMVGVRPNPKLIQHQQYHQRYQQISEKLLTSEKENNPELALGQAAKRQLNRFRDEDTDWFVRNSRDLASGLGSFSNLAGTLGLVTGAGALAISLTGIGAPAAVPLAMATTALGAASLAAKVLQGSVVGLDPNTPEGSSHEHFKDAALDAALLGSGKAVKKVIGGAKDVASVERMQGLAFLKDWRGITLQMLKQIDRMVSFLNSKFDRPRLQRIFGPSGLLKGPTELKERALQQIRKFEIVQDVLELTKDGFQYGEHLVKVFLGVVGHVKEGLSEGVDDLGEFIEGTGIRISDALRDAAHQLIEFGLAGPEMLARWGYTQTTRILSAGQRGVMGGCKRVGTAARRVAKASGRFTVQFVAGLNRQVIDILVRANLITRRVLATGEEVYEVTSEAILHSVNRILLFLQPGAHWTLHQMMGMINLVGSTFARTAHLGTELVHLMLRRATTLFGPAAMAVGRLFRDTATTVGGTVTSVFNLVMELAQRSRRFGEGALTAAIDFYGGLLGRVGRRILDFVSGGVGNVLPIFDLVTGMVRNRLGQGQDLLARLTEKGSSGLVGLLQTGVQRGIAYLLGASTLGHTAIDAAAGLGGSAIQRGSGLAQSFISRGLDFVGSLVRRAGTFVMDRIGLGTRTAHGATSIVERMLTCPVERMTGVLPPFALPMANRYLEGASRVGQAVHNIVDRAGTGASGGVGWLGRMYNSAANVGRRLASAAITVLTSGATGFTERLRGTAHRTVDRVSGNSMGFVGRMFSRVRSAIQTGANFVARLIRSPAATTNSGVQAGIQGIAGIAARTAAFSQNIVDRGAAVVGASASNPVVAGAHAAVSFAESAALRATSAVVGVTNSLFGFLQRDGTGAEPSVANPAALAESIRSRDRNVQLPPGARDMLSSQLGFDVSGVRIHAGAESNLASRTIGANAFTVGKDIFFRAGEYDPHSAKGKALLAHELTHVMQQGAGQTSAQRFRDSGGDAMEREAQDQGRAMTLAIREQSLGGIDSHDVDLRRADGALVSEDDRDRIARIQEMMEAKVLVKASAAGINRLVSSLVQVDINLDLENSSDDEAAERWAQAVIGAVRTTAEPIKVRSQLAVQPDVRSGLNSEAQVRLGQVPGGRQPSDIELNRRRTQQYAEMYLSNPRVFKWAGLAAFASRLVGQGIAGSQGGRAAGIGMMVAGGPMTQLFGAGLAANPLDRALLEGNRSIYDNIFWMHMAYQRGGIERIRQAHAEGTVPEAMLSAWELIHEGEQTNDETKIWAGNREFARHEQQVVVQPVYDKNPNLFGAMSAVMLSPAPGMEPGMRAPYQGEFMQQATPGANLANSDDRWNWVDNHMLPHWQALETQQPERVRYLLMELQESGGLINTFEDSDIRDGVAGRSDEDLAGVSGGEKIRLVNRLLSGWISDEDVDAAVRLLESIDGAEKVEEVAAGIAESMNDMWSSSQRGRLQLALSRARAKATKKAAATPSNQRTLTAQNVSKNKSRRLISTTQPSRQGQRSTQKPEVPSAPQPTPVDHAQSPADSRQLAAIAELAHAERMAEFADDVYQSTGAPVGSQRLDTDPGELAAMGLSRDSFHDDDSGFDAAVYREAESGRIIIAFRGTEATSAADWRTNVGQGSGMDMEQYRRAAELARRVRRAYPDANMEITGHSLGGGLATIASAATGLRATTFNAANVHPDTYGNSGATPDQVGVGSTNYTVDGEPLTRLQANGRGIGTVLGTVLGGVGFGPSGVLAGGVLGRRLGAQITHSPLRHEELEARNADGTEMGAFEHTGGHGMTGVREALAYRRAALEATHRVSDGD